MKRLDNKSHCPINFALETFGDPWSLLIVRDIVFFGKKTYGEFLASEERIATNVLASRLADMERRGIVTKCLCDDDKRKDNYYLTEKGLDLIPTMVEMSLWSASYDPDTEALLDFVEYMRNNKEEVITLIRDGVRAGNSVFVGPNSVASQLNYTGGAYVQKQLSV